MKRSRANIAKSFQYVMVIILAGVVAAFTLMVRIPTPASGGYLNFGDIGVVFCGLFLRSRLGALAGGIGSALADLVGGFFVFAPITFVAKGLEAFIAGKAGLAAGRMPWQRLVLFGIAGFAMVLVYFVAEIFLPGIGLSAAISSLPFNVAQAILGLVGGFAVYKAVNKALPPST